MRMAKRILRNEGFGVVCVMLLCFIFHIVVLNQFTCWFSTDTDGYWLHAASMAGYRWGDVAKNMNFYYSWGYSLLLALPMLITKNPVLMYKIAIVMNVVLCTLIVPIVYWLAKKMSPNRSRSTWLLMALIVSCYSTYVLESAVSLSETLIYFLTFLILFLLYRFFDTGKIVWAILSGLAVGYIYIVHNRCIGIVAAYVIIVVINLIISKDIKKTLALLVPLGCMLVLKHGVTNWLDVVEHTQDMYMGNTYDSMAKKASGLTFYSVLSIIQNVLGGCWYTVAGTFMLAGLGVFEIIKNRICLKKVLDGKTLFFVYVILSWLFLIGVSAVFFFFKEAPVSGRIDAIIYGRYMESSVGILILMGLIYLEERMQNEEWKKEVGLIVISSIVLSVLAHIFTTSYEAAGVNLFSIVAVLFPFSYGNNTITVSASSIVLLLIGVFVIYLFMMKRKVYKYLAYFCICGAFLYIGYNATYTVSRMYSEAPSIVNHPTCNADFVAICDCIEAHNIEDFFVLSNDGYEAFSYQFMLNDRHITGLKQVNELDDLVTGDVIVTNNEVDLTGWKYKVLYEGAAYRLIVLD